MLDDCALRRVPDHNLHMTLLFLGNQPADKINNIQVIVDTISCKNFTIALDQFGWFSGPRVLWLGGPAPKALQELRQALIERISALGLRFDRRPLRPHVTLCRQVDQLPQWPRIEPIIWPIAEFALVESIANRPYRVLRSWPTGRA